MPICVSDMMESDWPAVSLVYQEGINTGNATFASLPPRSWEEWCEGKLNLCSLVACDGDEFLGWAALSPISARKVYAGVAEVSVYISQKSRGMGVGSDLLKALISRSETNGIWTLQAMIFPENKASIHLHQKHGFREVGIREKIGRMEYGPYQGQWRDVVLLERRSTVAGIE